MYCVSDSFWIFVLSPPPPPLFTVINIKVLTYIKNTPHNTVFPSQTVRHFSNSGGLISVTWAACEPSSSEEVSHSYFKGISGFITMIIGTCHSLLSWAKWIQSTSSHLVSHIINLNIILLHVAWSLKWHLSFGFSKIYCSHLSSLSCVPISFSLIWSFFLTFGEV